MLGVGDHAAWLMERADQVLAARMIDAGLAADGRIDLREQRGRHLHVVDAALVAGRGEARHVADDAAAERDHGRVAIHALRDQRIEIRAKLSQRLVLLAVRQHQRRHASIACSAACNLARYSGATVSLVTISRFAAAMCVRQQLRVVEQPRPDQDRIAALAERDVDAFDARRVHGPLMTGLRSLLSARCTISSATARTCRPSVATMTLAIDSYSGARYFHQLAQLRSRDRRCTAADAAGRGACARAAGRSPVRR